jgi:hypothetical protein
LDKHGICPQQLAAASPHLAAVRSNIAKACNRAQQQCDSLQQPAVSPKHSAAVPQWAFIAWVVYSDAGMTQQGQPRYWQVPEMDHC